MSTRTKSSYQDPRYLQMWLTLEWPKPSDRVPVECADCGWTGRRARRSSTVRSCPRCAGQVVGRRRIGPRPGNVVQLAVWTRNSIRAGQPTALGGTADRPGAGYPVRPPAR